MKADRYVEKEEGWSWMKDHLQPRTIHNFVEGFWDFWAEVEI